MNYNYTTFTYDVSPSNLNDGYYNFNNNSYEDSNMSKFLDYYYKNEEIVSEYMQINTNNTNFKSEDYNIFYNWYTTGYNSPFKIINFIIINEEFIDSNTRTNFLGIINSVKNDTLLILNDIIKQSNILNNYNIVIDLDQNHFNNNQNENVIGWADYTTKTIGLNENVVNRFMYFNDTSKLALLLVLLHETLHILGLINLQSNYLPIDNSVYLEQVIDDDNNTRYIWTGAKGLEGYKKILKDNNVNNNIVDNVLGLLLENDGPIGTKDVHIEEGNNSNGIYKKIYVNNINYPSIANDITTGYLNTTNYLTTVTTGLLKDIGFIINDDSYHIMNTGINIALI